MKYLKKSVICLMVSSLVGCSGLDPFPADWVFVVNPDTQTCSKHEIIKKDPITVGDGIDVAWSECPHVFGFKDSDIAPVMDWMRKAERLAKEKCKQ